MSEILQRGVRGWGRPILLGACALSLAWVGCVSDRPASPGRLASAKGPIEQIHLISGPTALDLDNVPGPDGFGIRIYASNSKTPATVIIAHGTLEILMFDGLVKDANYAAVKPLRVWTFPAADLKKYAVKSSVGTAYDLTLVWDGTKPTQPRITIVARFTPQKGPPIYSGPSSISAAVR